MLKFVAILVTCKTQIKPNVSSPNSLSNMRFNEHPLGVTRTPTLVVVGRTKIKPSKWQHYCQMWVLCNSLANTSFSEPYLGAITHHNCLCTWNRTQSTSFSEDKDTSNAARIFSRLRRAVSTLVGRWFDGEELLIASWLHSKRCSCVSSSSLQIGHSVFVP